MTDRALRVCYFGTYDRNYVRNANLRRGLERQGVQVVECHAPLWSGTADKLAQVSGGWKHPSFWKRLARAYTSLLRQYRQVGDYDAMIVGYIGHLDMLLARALTRVRRRPLVFDVLMSVYLIASERGLIARNQGKAWFIAWLEKAACSLADQIWLDTPQYVDYFGRRYGLPAERFRLIPLGADESLFYPMPAPHKPEGLLQVAYFGGYVPLHGVETVVEAAKLLQPQPDIRFELIGDGQTRPAAQALAHEWGLTNVTFTDWVPREQLAQWLAGADVCLGVFGRQIQAQVTIPNKIYEGLALGRAVVTQGSPAARGQFVDREHMLFCQAGDASSLAQAILELRDDPGLRRRIADAGHRYYLERFTTASLGQLARSYLHEVSHS